VMKSFMVCSCAKVRARERPQTGAGSSIRIRKCHIKCYVRMNAANDGACPRCRFKFLPNLMRNARRKSEVNNNPCDASRWIGAHVFLCIRLRAVEPYAVPLRNDSHRRDLARCERCDDEIGRREALTAPLVIRWRICDELDAAGSMDCVAAELSEVDKRLGNHIGVSILCSGAPEGIRRSLFY